MWGVRSIVELWEYRPEAVRAVEDDDVAEDAEFGGSVENDDVVQT